MDRRQQKTRQAIFNAFSTLLERKSFGNITVQEIIDEANVGRSTFYAHFETKDSLLKAMCTDIFQHVFSDDLGKEGNHDFSHAGHDFEKELTHILYHLQDNRKNLKGLLSCDCNFSYRIQIKATSNPYNSLNPLTWSESP